MTRLLQALILPGIIVSSVVFAQNQVYDPLPPPGSAYVRFVNALGGEATIRPAFLPPQRLGTSSAERVTPYYVVEKVAGRDLELEAQEAGDIGRTTLHAEPGSFVTVIVEHPVGQTLTAVPVVDHTDFNQSRARLSFYNATPACDAASLVLDPDGPAVFGDVMPGTAKARSVNPVTARVRASCTGQTAALFGLEGLEPGGMYSIWLMMPSSNVSAFLTRDSTTVWKP
jgi:hypothetical protein